MSCPLEVCLARNRDRRGGIPERGLRAMARRFEPPTKEERALEIRTDQTDPEAAARRIYQVILRRHPRGEQGGRASDEGVKA